MLVFGLVLAKGRFNPRKRAVMLVLKGSGDQRKVQIPENKHKGLFLGGVWVLVVVVVREGGVGGQSKVLTPKMSAMLVFRGL